MEITLIRHTSVDVPKGICYGQTDVPLKDSFEQEAALTAEQLKGQRFDKVYTSPLSRCVRLADYCGYPEAIRDKRLMELNFGAWEMQRFDEIRDPRLEEWYHDYFHVAATDGESFGMQMQRVSEFLDELMQSNHQRVAVFAHGGVLICAQIYAGIIPLEEAFHTIPAYGEVIRIEMHRPPEPPLSIRP